MRVHLFGVLNLSAAALTRLSHLEELGRKLFPGDCGSLGRLLKAGFGDVDPLDGADLVAEAIYCLETMKYHAAKQIPRSRGTGAAGDWESVYEKVPFVVGKLSAGQRVLMTKV